MTLEDMQALLCILQALAETDRQSGCGDKFFRKLYTQRIAVLKVSGIMERLELAIAKASLEGAKR